jgi:hypothetical protein
LIALQVKENTILPGQLFELTNSRIVVTSITPQKDGAFLVRLFNPEYTVQQTQFNWKSLQPGSFIDITSGDIKSNTAEVKLAAMGVSEFLLKK